MFQGWRLKLREAEEALRRGRLEEARRMLCDANLSEFLPGQRLQQQLAECFAERGRRRVRQGDETTAWQDVEAARLLGGDVPAVMVAWRSLVDHGLQQAEDLLQAGDVAGCLRRLEQMERHGVEDSALHNLREFARRLESARHLVQRAKFAEAEEQLDAASALRLQSPLVEARRAEYREKGIQVRGLTEQLHRALSDERWSDTVTLANQLLELTPDYRLARDARRRAWAVVGAQVVDSRRLAETIVVGSQHRAAVASVAGMAPRMRASPHRFVMWIDGVGGYLVCLADEVMIGQAVPGTPVDIAIQGDLSRRHAKIRRRGEGYVIEPFQPVRVGGQWIKSITLLADGDEIQLGPSVRLRFRQPHALSASARLEMVSRHRTDPPVDGVLLMAESCVLGAHRNNHVVCRDWTRDVVLYRKDDDLYCRAADSIEVDGRMCEGRGRITRNSHITGNEFSLSLEAV